MAKQTKPQKDTIERVMHEFKHGTLDRAQGGKVRHPKQAIAIALHEAGASNQESSQANKRHLAATKRKERATPTRAELYEQAAKRNVPGRSRMTKAELEKAVRGK